MHLPAGFMHLLPFHSERIYTDASGEGRRIWNSPATPSVRLTLEMRY